MCFEDIKLGKQSFVKRNAITIPAGAGTQLVTPNADRVAIVIPNLGPGSGVSIDIQSITASGGTWSLANEGLQLSIQHYGQLVNGNFFAFNSGIADVTIVFYEIILHKEG